MKLKWGISLLLIAGTAAVAPLWSQGPSGGQPQHRPVLEAIDIDHDGTLSTAEIAAATISLVKLDRDGDGILTSVEFLPKQVDSAASDPESLVTRLMAFDRNGDGTLTPDEIPERLQGLMSRADANHDGKLTGDEIRAYAKTQDGPVGRTQHGPQVTRMDPVLNALDADHDGVLSAIELANAAVALKSLDLNGDGQLTPDEIKVKQMTPADRAAHTMEEWDTDKDGKLSKAEAPDRMQEQFDKIDANHDGSLDLQELTTFFMSQPTQRPRPADAPGQH